MEMALTAVSMEVPEGHIAFVEELAGTSTQGATLEEARENFREAAELVLEGNRALAREEMGAAEAIREPLENAGSSGAIWFGTLNRMAASSYERAGATRST